MNTVREVVDQALLKAEYLLRPLPHKEEDYISAECLLGGQKGKMSLSNAAHYYREERLAFYVGKFPTPEKIQEALEQARKEEGSLTIYSEELIEACLTHMARHLPPGEKATLLVGRELSVLCNPPHEMEGYLSYKEQMKTFEKIVARVRQRYPEAEFQIQAFEDLPHHVELFTTLQSKYDAQKGALDTSYDPETDTHNWDALFGAEFPEGTKLDADSNSFTMACYLYHHVFKKYPQFLQPLINAVPGQDKLAVIEEYPNRLLYPFLEVAIRMTDMLNGRCFQGGVSRQGVYDGIIRNLLSEQTKWKYIPKAIPELRELMKKKPFVAVHISPEKNYFPQRQKQIEEQTKWKVGALLGVGVLGAVTVASMSYNHRIATERDVVGTEAIAAQIGDNSIPLEGLGVAQVGPIESAKKIKESVEVVRCILKYRYMHIPSDVQEELSPMLLVFLTAHKDEVMNSIHTSSYDKFMFLADTFMKQYAPYLEERGIELGMPNQHLKEYENDLLKYAEGKGADGSVFADRENYGFPKIYPMLQLYSCYKGYWCDPVLVMKRSMVHMVAIDQGMVHGPRIESLIARDEGMHTDILSHKDLVLLAKHYVRDMRRFMITDFPENLKAAMQFSYNLGDFDLEDTIVKPLKKRHPDRTPPVTPMDDAWPITEFHDYFGRYAYDLIVETDGEWGHVVLGRKKGDYMFSLEVGIEASKEYYTKLIQAGFDD